MYQIDKKKNTIHPITTTTFQSQHFSERKHLQEWIAKNPKIFGEEFLIIQKEFDGFDNTRERLDLLALDKQGNFVIIENKLDDTGRDVVWQSLKYASYCSTLKRGDIIKIFQNYLDKYSPGKSAQTEIEEFYEQQDLDDIEFNSNQSQRIIFVAAKFRKEVTSTVLWLIDYGLTIQCFKATLYAKGENNFLTIDQIIPIKDAEDYTIKITEKKQEQAQIQKQQNRTQLILKEFWETLLPISNTKMELFSNIAPSTNRRISAGAGITGVVYSYVITTTYCRTELYPAHRKTAEENMKVFEYLYSHKDAIEQSFGKPLYRDRLEGKKVTRISYTLDDVNVNNKDDWDKMITFLTTNMEKLYKACNPFLSKY